MEEVVVYSLLATECEYFPNQLHSVKTCISQNEDLVLLSYLRRQNLNVKHPAEMRERAEKIPQGSTFHNVTGS